MDQVHGLVSADVVFIKPDGVTDDWEQSDLWTMARALPDTTLVVDSAGVEATRFHAQTSGQVVVYDAAGHLLFSGGITGARGHEGDNPGRERVVSLLTTGHAELATAPVFGCALGTAPAQ
jgi:hypothetical protein